MSRQNEKNIGRSSKNSVHKFCFTPGRVLRIMIRVAAKKGERGFSTRSASACPTGMGGIRRRGEGRIEEFGGCPSAGCSGCVTQRLNTRVTGEQRACDRGRGPNGCEFVLRNSRIAAEANIKWRNIEPCVVL